MGFFTINRSYFILKAHFFFFQAGIAPTQTAMPVYAQTLGFSSFIVGTVYTILPILGLFIKPGLGALADRFKWHKTVMLVVEFILMLSYFSVQFIPSGFTPPQKNVSMSAMKNDIFCMENVSLVLCHGSEITSPYIKARPDGISDFCKIDCSLTPTTLPTICHNSAFKEHCEFPSILNLAANLSSTSSNKEHCKALPIQTGLESPLCNDRQLQKSGCRSSCRPIGISPKEVGDDEGEGEDDEQQFQDDGITFSQYQFYVFLLLLVGSFGGTAVVTTLSDTMCIAKCSDPYLYGKQRLWGSIGYGVLSIISGFIVDAISVEGQPKDYTPAFYLCLGVMSFDIIMTYFYEHVEIPEQSQSIAKDVWKMLLNVKVVVFLIWCAAMGISLGITWTFLYWLLEDLAKSTGPEVVSNIKTIEGLTNGVQTFLGETPAFFFAGWILSKIGHGHSMSVILLTIGVRFVIYSFLSNPWYVLFVEPLQLYYGLFYCTMTSYANIVAAPGTEATVQSLMCAMCEGVGVAIGSFLGGLFYDMYGGLTTFRIFGISFLVMGVMNEGIELLYRFTPQMNDPAGAGAYAIQYMYKLKVEGSFTLRQVK